MGGGEDITFFAAGNLLDLLQNSDGLVLRPSEYRLKAFTPEEVNRADVD